MRVLFFDIDGVLNTAHNRAVRLPLHGTDKLVDVPAFDPECVVRFNRLVRETHAQVVLSATWGQHFSTAVLERHVHQQGCVCEVIGQTPVAAQWRPRGSDIADWLEWASGIESLCILDDHDDMLHLKRYLVQTAYGVGLQEQHVHQALVLLS
jgi:hypothetical protein